jgi:hypothetical protein
METYVYVLGCITVTALAGCIITVLIWAAHEYIKDMLE